MRRHVGIAAVDLRIVEAGLDHGDLGVVRHQQRRHAADRFEGADVAADPVGEPLRPGRLRVGEAGSAEHRDEDLRGAPLAGEPVDHHRDAVAGIIDEELVAGRMRLAHRHRQAAFPGAVELAEPRIAIPVGLARNVFLPQDRQRHVLAPELAVHRCPVRLRLPAMAPPRAGTRTGAGEQPGLQISVGDVRPVVARSAPPPQNGGSSTAPSKAPSPPPRNLAGRHPSRLQSDHIAHMAHRKPLRRHPGPLRKAERRDRIGARRGLVTPGDIIPEWWARSSRNGG